MNVRDIVAASSRGNGLEPEIKKLHPNPETVQVTWVPGGTLEKMEKTVTSLIKSSNDPTNCHAYLFAGLCNITSRERDCKNFTYNRYARYEECIYTEQIDETVKRISDSIDTISENILCLGAKPIFCPILTCSLRRWNYVRYEQGKTSFLMHMSKYEDMQASLNLAIRDINRYIYQTNESNSVVTPYLDKTIITKSPYFPARIHYNRFADGVHATDDLKKKWAKCLFKAMRSNRIVPNEYVSLLHDEFDSFMNQ